MSGLRGASRSGSGLTLAKKVAREEAASAEGADVSGSGFGGRGGRSRAVIRWAVSNCLA